MGSGLQAEAASAYDQSITPGTPTLGSSCQSMYAQNVSLTPAKDTRGKDSYAGGHSTPSRLLDSSAGADAKARWASPEGGGRGRGRGGGGAGGRGVAGAGAGVRMEKHKQVAAGVAGVRVEWESLADDLMLEDWREEEVADMEQLAVAALVRDCSGYYSDDFEPLSDDSDSAGHERER